MSFSFLAWIAVAINTVLLLVWVYSLFFRTNGVDPSGSGTAMALVIAFAVYIFGSAMLVRHDRTWAIITSLILSLIPMTMLVLMFVRNAKAAKASNEVPSSEGLP